MNYYEILQVDRKASDLEIRNAYRAIALEFHPDRAKESDKASWTAFMQDVNFARDTLTDARQRSIYDLRIGAGRTTEKASHNQLNAFQNWLMDQGQQRQENNEHITQARQRQKRQTQQ